MSLAYLHATLPATVLQRRRAEAHLQFVRNWGDEKSIVSAQQQLVVANVSVDIISRELLEALALADTETRFALANLVASVGLTLDAKEVVC